LAGWVSNRTAPTVERGLRQVSDGSFERIVPPGSDSSLVKDVNDRGTLLVNVSFGQLLRIDGQYEPIPAVPSARHGAAAVE
jgi:hypothetical protein